MHCDNNRVSAGRASAVDMSARWFLLLAMASLASTQTVEENAREFLRKFDEDASRLVYQYSLASWAYNTDISQENADKEVSMLPLYPAVVLPQLEISHHTLYR